MAEYAKPWLSVDEQIDQLTGLIDPAELVFRAPTQTWRCTWGLDVVVAALLPYSTSLRKPRLT